MVWAQRVPLWTTDKATSSSPHPAAWESWRRIGEGPHPPEAGGLAAQQGPGSALHPAPTWRPSSEIGGAGLSYPPRARRSGALEQGSPLQPKRGTLGRRYLLPGIPGTESAYNSQVCVRVRGCGRRSECFPLGAAVRGKKATDQSSQQRGESTSGHGERPAPGRGQCAGGGPEAGTGTQLSCRPLGCRLGVQSVGAGMPGRGGRESQQPHAGLCRPRRGPWHQTPKRPFKISKSHKSRLLRPPRIGISQERRQGGAPV